MDPVKINSLVYTHLAKVTPNLAEEFRRSTICFPSLVKTNLDVMVNDYNKTLFVNSLVYDHLVNICPELAPRFKLKRLSSPLPVKLKDVKRKFKKAKRKSSKGRNIGKLEENLKNIRQSSKEVLVSELYDFPEKVDRESQLGKICEYALKQKIPIGKLNASYTNCSQPTLEENTLLLKYFPGIKSARFTEEEDEEILLRLDHLVKSGLVTDFDGLVQEICDLFRMQSEITARNLLGLYVGQALLKNRLAYDLCNRLSNLILSYSVRMRKLVRDFGTQVLKEETKAIKKIVEEGRSSNRRTWSLAEDEELMTEVMKATGYRPVGQICDQNIQWEELAERFERKPQMVREHWSKILKPILATATCKDREAVEGVEFQMKLIRAILALDVKNRKEIDWKKLEKQFHPRSSLALQASYNALAYRLHKEGDIRQGLEMILDKLDHMEKLQESRQQRGKPTKKEQMKEALQDLYVTLLSKAQ